MRAERGFTLLEVVVAMAIIAVTLTGLIRLTTAGTVNRAGLEQRTLAHWVALNRAAELRAARTWPSLGRQDGSEEMGGEEWLWQQETRVTPDPKVREVRVRVSDSEGAAVTLLTVYLSSS